MAQNGMITWDTCRIDAAVSTLTEDLCKEYDVSVRFIQNMEETDELLYGLPVCTYGTMKTIITITPK